MENLVINKLIEKLLNCFLACEDCYTACLNEEDVNLMKRCIGLDRDCADICLQGVSLLKRNSEIIIPYLTLCEKVCRLCAEECVKHEAEHCKLCAAACVACADACQIN
ncbi:MAG: four-helix bundle copper-binding protein [Mucilaginibacter sp.]|nr:four-helix bundle copper-binding protein [Mucilaginibacter sp.]MDB5111593.1 four-helix bundle copper-binding protein [Mucilaginibacter sp.]